MNHQYPNSPLTEVVCELRFTSSIEWVYSFAEETYEQLRQQFPRRLEGGLRYISENENVDETLQCWRDDDSGVVILSPDALSVTAFKPYPGWESFRNLVMDVFEVYTSVAGPFGFRRIGLRYINDIVLPEGDNPINIYNFIRLGVVSSIEGVPNSFSAMEIQMDLPCQEARDNLSIGIVCPSSNQGQQPLIQFDLDYRLLDPQRVSLEETGQWLDQAHETIARVFEGTVKDNLRNLFNEEVE